MKGQLTIINLKECDSDLVRDKEHLAKFGRDLCDVIKMKAYGEPIIDRFGKDELEGYSLVQRIETSNITVHLDEFENKVFVDIFSCKEFNEKDAAEFSKEFFRAKELNSQTIMRE